MMTGTPVTGYIKPSFKKKIISIVSPMNVTEVTI